MRAAIYCRVSKEEEGLQDPSNQLIPCRKYCNNMGWDIQAEYIDRCSGGDSNRPEFQKMLCQVRQNRLDIIVVWALDRFSREGIMSTLAYIKQLKEYNTHLKSLQESYLDTRTPGVAELMLSLMSWVAAEERRKISERTKAGLERKRKQGVRLGRPPGSKDKKRRRRSGYYMRFIKEKEGKQLNTPPVYKEGGVNTSD